MPLFKRKGLKFSLKRKPKIRANWKIWNLFELSRLAPPPTTSRTFFQQKWTAKAMTRAYHGEYVKEKQWERMFSRRTAAVVPMEPNQLAESDGAEFAAGRGSGTQTLAKKIGIPQETPYMQMVYHPLERRLDTAIFRALFASSTGQARQMVTHGHVRVNGKKMIYPGYLLNPGDMFQVDVEQVLTAIGCHKGYLNNPNNTLDEAVGGQARVRVIRRQLSSALAAAAVEKTRDSEASAEVQPVDKETEQQDEEQEEDDFEDDEGEPDMILAEENVESDDPHRETKKTLLALRTRTKQLISEPPAPAKKLSATQKQEARALSKKLRSSLSRAAQVTASALDDFEAEFHTLYKRITSPQSSAPSTTSSAATATATEAATRPASGGQTSAYAKRKAQREAESAAVQALLDKQSNDNPYDPAKPYLTPWQPKDFMSAFAFIPRYLEVNQNICSAVYLRHPVVKPGFAEVPSPFPQSVGQAAFNWYLRRR